MFPDSEDMLIAGGKTISRAATRAVEVVRKETRKRITNGKVLEEA